MSRLISKMSSFLEFWHIQIRFYICCFWKNFLTCCKIFRADNVLLLSDNLPASIWSWIYLRFVYLCSGSLNTTWLWGHFRSSSCGLTNWFPLSAFGYRPVFRILCVVQVLFWDRSCDEEEGYCWVTSCYNIGSFTHIWDSRER